MWIEKSIKKIYCDLTTSEKAAFTSTFVCGLIAHLYIYTNTIPNFDGISRVFDEQQMTISGRWFLHYASSLNSFTQMPMVIGVLSMLFLAASALLLVRMFEVKSCLLAGIWGVLFVTFPAMADTNTYTFTVSAYCIAIFLAVLSVFIKQIGRGGIFACSILLAFSVGIYQAYLPVAIVLSVLCIIKEVLKNEKNVRELLKMSGEYILFLGLGSVIYYIVLKLFLYLKDLKLISYLGLDNLESGYPYDEIGNVLIKTYTYVGNFFFGKEHGLNNPIFIMCNSILAICTLILFVKIIKANKLWIEKIKYAGLMVLIILIPVSANFTQIINPYTSPRLITSYALVYFYFVPVMFLEYVEWEGVRKRVQECIAVAIVGCMIMLSAYFWNYDNLIYTMLNQAHRATLSYVTNVVSRIESCEGYQMGMKVFVIGGFPADRYDTDIAIYDSVRTGSLLSSSVIPLNKHVYYYMNDWLNVPIQEPEEEEFLKISESEVLKKMPLYPNDGSVQIIDGSVVVKISDTFVPRAAYEKQYENRK